MFNISSFLEKFSKNINSAGLHTEQIIEIIRNETKIKLEKKDVEIKNNIIYIQSSGAVKNKIFIFKNQIISSINSQTPLKVIDVK